MTSIMGGTPFKTKRPAERVPVTRMTHVRSTALSRIAATPGRSVRPGTGDPDRLLAARGKGRAFARVLKLGPLVSFQG